MAPNCLASEKRAPDAATSTASQEVAKTWGHYKVVLPLTFGEQHMNNQADTKLITLLGVYLNQKLGKKIDVGFKVVEIKGTAYLMPELPDDVEAIERLTTSIERHLMPGSV